MLDTRLVILFILLGLAIEAQTFGMPMGGGGGCGCGGRKKRDVIEQQVRTERDSPCPQTAWKEVIEASISQDAESSKYAVQGALFKTYETKFFVTCTKTEDKHHLQFVTNAEGYCTTGNDKIWCAAAVLQA